MKASGKLMGGWWIRDGKDKHVDIMDMGIEDNATKSMLSHLFDHRRSQILNNFLGHPF